MIAADGGLARLLQILLPNGGHVFMSIEAYFDESGTHEGEPVMCVAGFLFEKTKCEEFDREWRQMFADFRVSYFHMTEIEACAPDYCHLGTDLRKALVRRAIGIIKKTFTYGLAVSAETPIYEKLMPAHRLIGGPYTHCATGCMRGTRVWAERNNYHDDIAYVFESGHEHEFQTYEIMSKIVKTPQAKKDYRYGGHSFQEKKKSTPLQAADLLAWQYLTNRKRVLSGGFSRDDFCELVEKDDERFYYWHHDEQEIRYFAGAVKKADALWPLAALEEPPDPGEQ